MKYDLRGWAAPLLLLLACRSSRAAPAAADRAVPVDLAPAKRAPVDDAAEYLARIESRRSIDLMPQVEGRITKIFVKAGESVTPGQAIVEIDPREQRAEVRAAQEQRRSAEASMVYAREQFERSKRLFETGAISQAEFDQARSVFLAAQANFASLASRVKAERVQLHYYTVTAPFESVVGDLVVRLGDQVTTSTVLTTLDAQRRLQVYVYVPGEEGSRLKVGLPVRLLDPEGKVVEETTVAFVSPRVDRDTQTILLTANVANDAGSLRQDEQMRARVVFGSEERILVPTSAISRLGAQAFVFVAERAAEALVARQRPVELGSIVGNDYVVEKGLVPGEQVAVSGIQKLRDGSPVKPRG